MSEQIFMVDIETTGTDFKTDDILQIGILKLSKNQQGYWEPGRVYETFLGTDRQPANKFAKEYMGGLYAKCNLMPKRIPEEVRNEIKTFLNECNCPAMAVAVGKNASSFDLPFLAEKGFIHLNVRDPITDVLSSDFHYRVYEMGGALSFAQDVLSYPSRKDLEKFARDSYPEIALPEDRSTHDAVYDCYAQTRELNGLIRMCRLA